MKNFPFSTWMLMYNRHCPMYMHILISSLLRGIALQNQSQRQLSIWPRAELLFFLHRCICKDGWEGKDCVENINDCVLHNCQNGASCIDEVNSYTCKCRPGYKGESVICHSNLTGQAEGCSLISVAALSLWDAGNVRGSKLNLGWASTTRFESCFSCKSFLLAVRFSVNSMLDRNSIKNLIVVLMNIRHDFCQSWHWNEMTV